MCQSTSPYTWVLHLCQKAVWKDELHKCICIQTIPVIAEAKCCLQVCTGILYTVVYIYTVQLIYRYFGTLRVTKYFQWKRTIPKLAASHGRSRPPPNTWFIGAHPSQYSKWHLDCISHFSTTDHILSLYFTMGWDMSPQNCPFPWGNRGHDLTHGSLGPPESTTQTGCQLIQPFCMPHSLCPTDRHTQTDRPRYICSNRPHLMVCIVMQPNSTISFNSWLSFQWLCHLLWGWAPQQVQFNKAKHLQVSVHNTASNIHTYP